MSTIRILLADDHAVLRYGVIALLAQQTEFEIVGEASDADSTLELTYQLLPDILLMDYRMPAGEEDSAIKVVATLYDTLPQTRVIVFSGYEFPTFLKQSFRFGARGYLLKDRMDRELVDAIKTVDAGGIFISEKLQKWVKYNPKAPHEAEILSVELLTTREDEVFHLLIQGLERQEIARLLGIDKKTFDNFRSSILYKLGVKNVAQLVHYAIEAGLFSSSMSKTDVTSKTIAPKN